MMVSVMFFTLEILVYLVMSVKHIGIGFACESRCSFKIHYCRVMIVVCSHLRSFVHFPHVKDSWGSWLLYLRAERKRQTRCFVFSSLCTQFPDNICHKVKIYSRWFLVERKLTETAALRKRRKGKKVKAKKPPKPL